MPERSLALLASLALACGAPPPGEAPTPAQPVPKASEPATPPTPPPPAEPGPLPAAERAALPGKIAYVAEPDGVPRAHWMSPAGQVPEAMFPGTGPIYPAAITRAGDAIAAIAVEEQGELHRERLQVWKLGPGAPTMTWESEPTTSLRNPSWAPDGRFIVFEADFVSFREIYRHDLGSPKPKRLTNNEEGNFEPDVSPDGLRIAFASSRDGNAEIYSMAADGTEPRRLTTFHRDDSAPKWSPDGRAIAFLSNRDGAERVYLMNPEGAELRRLTAPQTEALPSETWPMGQEPHEVDHAWAPDGRAIAFSVRTGPEGASLRIADPARPGEFTILTDGRASDRSPAFSPDGRHLVFVSNRARVGALDLYVLRVDGSALARLTDAPGADWLPRWFAWPAG